MAWIALPTRTDRCHHVGSECRRISRSAGTEIVASNGLAGRLLTLLLALAMPALAAAGPFSWAIYPAPTMPLEDRPMPDRGELVTVTAADGLEISGIHVPPREGRPLLLAFPGNASDAADSAAWMQPLLERGFGLVAANYRGYGGNPGEPSAAGLAKDADAFMAFARVRHPGARIWIIGHSLGGAVALALAERSPPDRVLTWGTFTTLRDMAPRLGRLLVADVFRNADIVPRLEAPWFLVHGFDDEVVPASHGERLHALAGAASRRGASFVIVGSGHVPDGRHLLSIIETAEDYLATGRLDAHRLGVEVKLIPFGQTRPLEPIAAE
jgi:pimeloyl-ACP methyl ester carboxylesterase